MHLIKYLLLISVVSILFGAFGHYPFGASSTAISITDILVGLTLGFYLIWLVLTKEKVVVSTLFKLLIAFWGVGLFSLIFSLRFFNQLELVNGLLYYLRFVGYSSLMPVASYLHRQGVLKLEQFLEMLIRVGGLFIFLGFIQLLILPDFSRLSDYGFDPHLGRLTSTFLDPNYAGALLTVTLALAIYKLIKSHKKSWLILIALALVSLLLTYSRSGYLMAVVFILVAGILKWRRLLLIPLVAVIISLIFFPRVLIRVQGAVSFDKTAEERLKSWQVGLSVIEKSPIIGVGFNNLRVAQMKWNLFRPETVEGGASGGGVDSGLLLVTATTGILGLGVFVSFWALGLKNTLVCKDKIAGPIIFSLLLSLIINGQLINSLFLPAFMVWYFPVLGIIDEN